MLWLALLLILGGSYWGLRALSEQKAPGGRHGPFNLRISDATLNQTAPLFKMTQGAAVTFVIRSERPGELHIHGYEKVIPLQVDRQIEIHFPASMQGMFPVHLHDPDGLMHQVATMEVLPP